MSKIKDKVVEKMPKKLQKDKTPPAKITNDTIAEHREKILAGGRKFKYPFQYSKHKILINAVIVSVAALIGFGTWSWVMLYKNQATGDFFYSMTKILPLPVSVVDGENVPYSDYLRRMRSAIFYKNSQEKIDLLAAENKDELNYLRRDELNKAQQTAYARKIARSKNITVSDQEIEKELNSNLKSKTGDLMSQSDYENNVLKQYFGWTLDEYRIELHNRLLEKKVAFAVDTKAKQRIESAKVRLDRGDNFADVARETSDDEATRESGGGVVAKVGDSDTSGIVAAARQLEPGKISGIIQGVRAYYIVRLDSKTDDTTNFSFIKINLTQFDNDFKELRKQGKIKECIDVPEWKD